MTILFVIVFGLQSYYDRWMIIFFLSFIYDILVIEIASIKHL